MAKRDFNRLILCGNLTADPESIGNGKGCRFTIATNESYTNASTGEVVEHVEYTQATFWDATAKAILDFMAKGSDVLIEGAKRTETWDDNDTGEKRYRTVIKPTYIRFNGTSGRTQEHREPDEF